MPPSTTSTITPSTMRIVLFMARLYLPPSEVVAGVGLVERLVAEREVRDDVLEQRIGQGPPVEEGRVEDLAAPQPPARSRHDPVDDGAPPPLDHGEGRREGGQLAQGSSEEHTSELQSQSNLLC